MGVLTILKKDAAGMLREKSFLLIFVSQLIFVALSIIAIQGFPQILEGGFRRELATLCYQDPKLLGLLLETSFLLRDASLGLEGCDALILLEELGGVLRLKAYVREGPKAALIVMRLRQVASTLEEVLREEKLRNLELKVVGVEVVEKPGLGVLIYALLLPLLLFSAFATSGMLAANLLSNEVEAKTIYSLLAAPLSKGEVVLAKVLTPALFCSCQVGFWLLVFEAYGFKIFNSFPLLLASSCYALIFASFGALAFLVTKNRNAAQNLLTLLVAPLFLTMLPIPLRVVESSRPLLSLIPAYQLSSLAQGRLDPQLGAAFGLLLVVTASLLFFITKAVRRWEP